MLKEEKTPPLEDLLEDFFHPNPNINHKACLNMIRYWPEDFIRILTKNLSIKDIELRRKSVKALGCFGDKAILPISKIFFASTDLTTRISCLKIFVKIAAIENYQTLPETLSKVIASSAKNDDPLMILSSVSLLRQLGKPAILKLIELSKDENILRSKAAITALGEIDDPAATSYLRALLQKKSIDKLIEESIIYALENSLSRPTFDSEVIN